MIESYSFGRISIDGRVYTRDLIVCPDCVEENWFRRSGHELCVGDIEARIIRDKPEVLVVGTGQSGILKVLPETEEFLENMGIELIAQNTGNACNTFNEVSRRKRAMGAFHLTC